MCPMAHLHFILNSTFVDLGLQTFAVPLYSQFMNHILYLEMVPALKVISTHKAIQCYNS